MSSVSHVDPSWDPYASFQALFHAPVHHLTLEALLVIWVLWLLFRKSYRPEPVELTEEEKNQLIEEWQPEPLVPETPQDHYALNPRVVSSKVGKYTVVDDKKCLNLASHNYLGMTEEQCLEEKAINCLHKYGVGSCGPRGFYGTVDIHLHLEAKIAKFLRVEEAVLYSYGFSAIASAIPAYSKVGDIIFVDEGVNFAIQKGLTASRSKIKLFKHNDVKDLARILDEQAKIDAKNPKKAAATRKFMVIEGLYMKTGDICPLPEIIELKKKHKIRLFLDESFSFGTLGEHGRGVTEHFNIPVEDIDHISGSLENAIGAYGGFCAGTTFIVDHQRLSGLGYCFSASLPPLQAAVALDAIDIIENSSDLLTNLRRNSESFHSLIAQCETIQVEGLMISPVKHLRFKNRSADCHRETQRLESVVQKAWNEGVALTVARYLTQQEINCPEPSIRIAINARFTAEQVEEAVTTIIKAFNSSQ